MPFHHSTPAGVRRARPAAAAFLTWFAIAVGPVGAQTTLDDTEAAIARAVESNQPESVELLERIVNLNSGTLNAAGQRAVHDALAPHFERLGFEVDYLPGSPDRGGHFVARRRGSQGKHLLLIGHLDTVFEVDSPFQRWEWVNDSIGRGPGANDMKGGNVVIWSALQAMHAEGALDNTSITVVMTGDEERPGRPLEQSRAVLLEAGRDADLALGFEGGTDGLGVVARRSSSSWRIDVQATTAHSSGVFRDLVGAGAIYEAGRILEDFYSEIRGEENLTFNAATIVGGTEISWDAESARGTAFGKTNVVPPAVVITGDIRTLTDDQLERTREKMRQIVARPLPGARSDITFTDGYPSMPPTEGNYALLARLSEASEALGHGPVEPFDPGRRGAADVSFVASVIEAGTDGLGPSGSGSHTVRETVNVRSMERASKRAAILMYRLTR